MLNNIAAIHFYSGEFEKAVEILEQIIISNQMVGAAFNEATYRVNLAMALKHLNRIAEAIDHVRQAIVILQESGLMRDSGGVTLDQYELLLRELESEQNSRLLLSVDLIEHCVRSTIDAKIGNVKRGKFWRQDLKSQRITWANRGWKEETAFADALLAVLDNQPASLPNGNHYHVYLQRVLDAIAPNARG